MRGKYIIALVVLLFCSSMPVHGQDWAGDKRPAQHGGGDRELQGHRFGSQGPGGKLKEIFGSLNLTEDQRKAMKELRASSKGRELREKLMQQRADLRSLMEDRSSEESAVKEQLEALLQTQADLSRARVVKILAVRSILDEQQFKKLTEKMRQFKEEMMHRGPMGGGADGSRGRGGFRPPQRGSNEGAGRGDLKRPIPPKQNEGGEDLDLDLEM